MHISNKTTIQSIRKSTDDEKGVLLKTNSAFRRTVGDILYRQRVGIQVIKKKK